MLTNNAASANSKPSLFTLHAKHLCAFKDSSQWLLGFGTGGDILEQVFDIDLARVGFGSPTSRDLLDLGELGHGSLWVQCFDVGDGFLETDFDGDGDDSTGAGVEVDAVLVEERRDGRVGFREEVGDESALVHGCGRQLCGGKKIEHRSDQAGRKPSPG